MGVLNSTSLSIAMLQPAAGEETQGINSPISNKHRFDWLVTLCFSGPYPVAGEHIPTRGEVESRRARDEGRAKAAAAHGFARPGDNRN
jgi:hypothetical protein